MKKIHFITTGAMCIMIGIAGSASAADYSVTWINRLGTSECTPLVVNVNMLPTGNIEKQETVKFSHGEQRKMTVSALTCQNIVLKANCIYTVKDKKGTETVLKRTEVPLQATVPCTTVTATIVYPPNITYSP